MLRIALASVLSHKVRLLLTSLAIVLGVAFVSGSFVLTDTITSSFNNLLGDISAGTDVYVRPPAPEFGNDFGAIFPSMPEEVVDDVAAVEGVAIAEGSVEGLAQIIDKEGNPIGGQGPPTLGFSWGVNEELSPVSIAEGDGRPPEAPGEVVIDRGSAESAGLEVGDVIGIAANGPVEEFTLVGIAGFGEADNLLGATLAAFEYREAQRVLGMEGAVGSISVAAEDGVSPDVLVERITPVVPEDATVLTVEDANAEQAAEIEEAMSFLSIGLLAFAAIAVFVGAFMISNTFRIIVAQRTRELALLRAVGATGGQVTRLVVVEAFVVSLVSSLLGVVAGIGLAFLLQGLMRTIGIDLPDEGLTILPRTIVVGMVVGVLVTVASAILPARKAAQVPPVAAMSEVLSAPTRKSLRTRAIWGVVITVVGHIGLGIGLFTGVDNAIWFVAIGALLAFLGVSILAPLIARPVAAVIGWPLPHLFGVPGDLAVQNTRRQPRRTASTASALMIGVTLVVFVAIFGASIKSSVGDALSDTFGADISITPTNFQSGISPQFSEDLAAQEAIGAVSPLAATQARVDGDVVEVDAVDPQTVDGLLDLGVDQATLDAMGTDGLLINADQPDADDAVGTTVTVEMPNGTSSPGEIVGVYDATGFGAYLMTRERFQSGFDNPADQLVFANAADGYDVSDAVDAANAVIVDYPGLEAQTASEVLQDIETQIDQLLAIFQALLMLAVIIAVLGITNTLALSIIERTREIGLLRAVGMVRRQVRRMIRWEAVIIATFGALLGIVLGILLGWAVVRALADDGLGAFAIPFADLIFYVILAAIAGIIAAIYPARKAAKLNILEAISYE